MHGAHDAGGHAATGEHEHRSWATLAVLAVAEFMVILDVTVVNVALPSIGRSLHFDPADLPWVVTAYVLVTGALMLLGGRLTDRVGRRPVLLAGVGIFTAASLASGLAWSPESLIASRAVQGLGGALLLPAALAIVTTTYHGRQRAIALGLWGAIGSAGAAAGMLIGGVLTELLSWEWIFLVNVPVGLAAAAAALHLVPAGPPPAARVRLDLPGALTLLAGLGVGLYAVEQAPGRGWGSAATLLLLATAGALLVAFAAVERRGRAPLVPPATWRARSLRGGAVLMLGGTGLLGGSFLLNTIYLQEVLGASPIETGLAFLPLALAILAAAHAASHLMTAAGSRAVASGGLALMGAGSLLIALAPDGAAYARDLLPGFLALGIGAGLTFVSVSVTAMADVAHETAGLASGVMTTAHEVGAALGVGVLTAIALGAGDLALGHERGFVAAAVIAAVLAAVAVAALPEVRPAPGSRPAMH
ncbi:MAG TPA: MFS transporter [Capillimicrobium sp.]|nr:MFS transporter [Capillimicrobium sp.]